MGPSLLTCGLAACGADSLKPEAHSKPSDVYWSLTLNHRAATMGPPGSPYDTLTLVATPRNAAGDALAGLPAPTYLSTDVTKVTVTPDGLVRVLGSGFEPVWVVAALVVDNVRHMDSVRVRSLDIDPPPVLTTFSIHPVPPDSAKRSVDSDDGLLTGTGFPPIQVHATDASGTPITDLMVSFQSLNLAISGLEETTGIIHPLVVGEVTFTASTTMFGIAKSDTVRYRIGWPLAIDVNVDVTNSSGRPLTDTLVTPVGTGGVVSFFLLAEQTGINTVEFDSAALPNIREPSASAVFAPMGLSAFCSGLFPLFLRDCGSGNVVTTLYGEAMRAFLSPGTYYYRAHPSGVVGRIDVIDER